jgi:hypothetical protein
VANAIPPTVGHLWLDLEECCDGKLLEDGIIVFQRIDVQRHRITSIKRFFGL